MQRRIKTIILAFSAFAVLAIFLWNSCAGEAVLKRFDLIDGHQLYILTDSWIESGQNLYYKVTNGKQEIIPLSRLGTVGPDTKFIYKLHQFKDGKLVGITTEEYPDELIIVHDFDTGESWPYQRRESEPLNSEDGKKLLNKFPVDFLKTGLKLGILHQ